MFPVTEQRLLDRKNNILKKNWLTDLEFEEIRRNIEELEQGNIFEEIEVDTRAASNIASSDRSNENGEIDENYESNLNVNEEEKRYYSSERHRI